MFGSKYRIMRNFVRENYSDNSLHKLLDAAQRRDVIFYDSRRCLVGRSDSGSAFSATYSAPAQAFLHYEFFPGRRIANKVIGYIAKQEIKRRAKLNNVRTAEGRELTEDLLRSSLAVEQESKESHEVAVP